MIRVWNKRLHNVPAGAIYVGRPTDWGNPYILGRDGSRQAVVARYEAYARGRLQNDPEWLAPLLRHDLVCWCAPDACHADVLATLIVERYGVEVAER